MVAPTRCPSRSPRPTPRDMPGDRRGPRRRRPRADPSASSRSHSSVCVTFHLDLGAALHAPPRRSSRRPRWSPSRRSELRLAELAVHVRARSAASSRAWSPTQLSASPASLSPFSAAYFGGLGHLLRRPGSPRRQPARPCPSRRRRPSRRPRRRPSARRSAASPTKPTTAPVDVAPTAPSHVATKRHGVFEPVSRPAQQALRCGRTARPGPSPLP
jgi:hypothetical protein